MERARQRKVKSEKIIHFSLFTHEAAYYFSRTAFQPSESFTFRYCPRAAARDTENDVSSSNFF
jgi:hypothetical protein